MDGLKKLAEILYECDKQHDKVVDWYKEYENDELFKTEDGSKLRNHLGAMIKNEALAMLMLGKMELKEALKCPEIFSSMEVYESFKNTLKD